MKKNSEGTLGNNLKQFILPHNTMVHLMRRSNDEETTMINT